MATKKKSCALVQRGIAGPTPNQVLDAIRAEYWLPADAPAQRGARTDAAQPNQSKTPKPPSQVKS